MAHFRTADDAAPGFGDQLESPAAIQKSIGKAAVHPRYREPRRFGVIDREIVEPRQGVRYRNTSLLRYITGFTFPCRK